MAIQKRPGVTIENGPSDWQIIQRDKNGFGQITIDGFYYNDKTLGDFWVQARLVDQQTNSPVTRYLDWQDAALLDNDKFSFTFEKIPAGGLYRIETRIKQPYAPDARGRRGDHIHHIGVGDIYIIAGQSNASGTGKGFSEDGPQLGVHLLGNDENWKLAMHPVEDATATLHPVTITGVFQGTSPWLSFGRRILNETKIPIGLIPTALGGSLISMWIDDAGKPAKLFDNMMDMFSKAGGKVAGVLWHQGESDAGGENLELYADRFKKLVALFRSELGDVELPVITGQLNGVVREEVKPCPWSRMREIQRTLASEIDGVYMAVTIDAAMSDEIHNSSEGCALVGRRYADLALAYIYSKPILAECPEPSSVKFIGSDRDQIKVSFNNMSGDWTPNDIAKSFYVEDDQGDIGISEIKRHANGDIDILLTRSAKASPMLHALYGMRPEITLRDDDCKPITPFSLPIAD